MNAKSKHDVTEKDFKIYEKIRESGVTNMFNVSRVKAIASATHDHVLDEDTIKAIMNNYSELKEEYGGNH